MVEQVQPEADRQGERADVAQEVPIERRERAHVVEEPLWIRRELRAMTLSGGRRA